MNSDLKIGLVVSVSVIICLFFVAFTSPNFENNIEKELDNGSNQALISKKTNIDEESKDDLEMDDDFSLEYVTLGDDDKKNKVESQDIEKEKIVKSEIEPEIENDEFEKMKITEEEIILKDEKDKTLQDSTNNELEIKIIKNEVNPEEDGDAEISSNVDENTASDEIDQKLIMKPKIEVRETLKEALQEDMVYTIKAGDNLSKIAKFYYLDALKHVDISKANNGLKSNNLKIGQKIKLPGIKNLNKEPVKPKKLVKSNLVTSDQDIVYQVKKGDIASIIIQKYYGSFKYLKNVKKANPKVNLDRLKIGQKLILPGLGKNKN